MFYSRRVLTRRDFGNLALATVPAIQAWGAINSKFNGVQIGAITYSFRSLPNLDEIIKSMVEIGLSEVELMADHAESAAGAPAPPMNRGAMPGGNAAGRGPGGGAGQGRAELTPEQREAMQAARRARAEEMRQWRLSVSMDSFKPVRKKFNDVGIDLALLCFNMNENTSDDEIEYGFQLAKALGVRAITTSTQLTVAKRVAPFADKHKLMVGYHGHDQTSNPNEFSTPETFATAMSYSKYHGVNLDIGHFISANHDPIAYIKEHHARITNLHLKDRKKDHGGNVPWGEGDTPIKEVLQLVAKAKYTFPANIEMEYRVPEGSSLNAEIAKCVKYCKDVLGEKA